MGPVFVADVHLDPAAPERGRRFAAFLERLPAGTDLWLLGDLVEAWAEAPGWDLADLYPEIGLLRRHRVRFIAGNRDFLAGPRFAAATGAEVLGDWAVVPLDGGPVVATHGDLLCRRDVRYRLWRRAARSNAFRLLPRLLGPARARRWAEGLRAASRAETARKGAATMDADSGAARAALDRLGGRDLVAGHVHRPGVRDLGGGRRLVLLGHWGAGGEVAVRRGEAWSVVPPEALPVS